MADITHTFNYAKPDEYLGQFDNQQLVGTRTKAQMQCGCLLIKQQTRLHQQDT